MRPSSQSSQFVFNLPSDFVPQEVIFKYNKLLEKNFIQYENVIDYLNSTIRGIDFTGIRFDGPSQYLKRGKERQYKPATNVQDIVGHDINITFESVDSHLNYWMIFEIITKHYLDVENLFLNPFTLTALDIHRDAIYRVNFKEIILKNLSDMRFDYSQQKVQSNQFTMTFRFNFYDVEFLLDESKILELEDIPKIIQKI